MGELSIKKKSSKLPKVALILGIVYLACSALCFLAPLIFDAFILDHDVAHDHGYWTKYAETRELLSSIGIIGLMGSWICFSALLFLYTREHKNRLSMIAAISYCIITILCIVFYLLAETVFGGISHGEGNDIFSLIIINVILFFPLQIITLGFLADSFGKNRIARSTIVAPIIISAITVITTIADKYRPEIFHCGIDIEIYLSAIYLALLLIGLVVLGFFVGHYRKDKALLIPGIIAIPILLIFKPFILYIFLLIAAIATITYHFVSKSSLENSTKLTHCALLITILYCIIGTADNLSIYVQMGHNQDIVYSGILIHLILSLSIFSIFLLPATANIGDNQDSKALKIAKIVPFAAITLLIFLNVCLRYVHWDSWKPICLINWFTILFICIACCASAISVFGTVNRNKTE